MIGDKNAAFASSVDEKELRFLKLDHVAYPNGTAMLQLRRRDAGDERACVSISASSYEILSEFRALVKWLEGKT